MDSFFYVLKIIGYICVFFLILYLAQYTSKYLAKKNEIMYRGKKVKILERLYLSRDKEVILLQYRNKEYLIGVSQNITKIDIFELKDDNGEEI